MTSSAEFDMLVQGRHSDPFAVLGCHRLGTTRVVRTFQPQAKGVELLDRNGVVLSAMTKVHGDGLFEGLLPARKRRYKFRITSTYGNTDTIEDAYRFPSSLGDLDLHLLGEGSDLHIYDKLGAQLRTHNGVRGTRFSVWAPNASRISVIGDFNDWDGRRHIMRLHPANGIWEIFLPGIGAGAKYKFEMLDQDGALLPLKSDPFGRYFEPPPGNAAIVYESNYKWRDAGWISRRNSTARLDTPVSIYEVHPGSWRRSDDNRYLTYRELADQLVTYVSELGFTHIELMPVTEHPFDGSWGYQPIGMFAPTQRFGEPDDFRYFVDCCHAAGISVILDWVPAHFPQDEHGLRLFDGTALYEHEDPRKGEHADWGTLIFNLGRREVSNYLLGNALYWIKEFHIDALRVDAVASMLYLDYSRDDGEWIANEFGGNENLEAVSFLRKLNIELHAHGANSYAEESTAWPGVSHPVDQGGLGFTFKWNMGWMNDTLSYISEEPIHRKYHHDKTTFGLVYANDENFVLPLSHDEVVHGKGSLLGRMPGDEWQRFANLRAYLGYMFGHPGKNLLFMGSEIAQYREWAHDRELDWNLLDYPYHAGMQQLVSDLNAVYRRTPALYECDFTSSGFEWIDANDRDNSILSWIRRDSAGRQVICITNFTPVIRDDYKIAVTDNFEFQEILNTNDQKYAGAGSSKQLLRSDGPPFLGKPCSLSLAVPPLATLMLQPADSSQRR